MKKRMIQIIFLVGGVVLAGLGIFRGELAEILRKGATVCLECIGIG
jgi:hypothetical protein